jgi:CBS domain-containing protein
MAAPGEGADFALMATNDPKSRLTENNLNSPYTSPNGVTESQGATPGEMISGSTGSSAPVGGEVSPGELRPEESPGEKIGRFFRRAMERIAGRDDDSWRRENDRDRREREVQERSRAGETSWQVGRSHREHGRSEWSDLGRPGDDRSQSYRAGAAGDTAGSYERLQSSQQASVPSFGQSWDERDQRSFGFTGDGTSHGQSASGDRQTSGQGARGRNPGEGGGIPEVPGRRMGSDRAFEGGYGRDDQFRDVRYRAQGAARRDWRGQERGATGMGLGRDDLRAGEWGETARDRDEGQGRRFWQREPLAARDVMTRNPRTVTPQSSYREAAVIMRDENCGVVPVVDGAGRLEGILTDRDIVVRGLVSEGVLRRIEDMMTDDVSAVTEDEPLTSVLDLMGRKQIRRVPVVDRSDRLLGIISMADIANRADYDEDLQDAFERISSRRSFWSLFS